MRHSVLPFVLAATAACAAPGAYADVVISSGATQNMTCSAGVCAPKASDAVLNVGDLETLLASGNVEVTTTGSGVQAGNIDVSAALSWASSGTLTLSADRYIYVHRAVSITGAGGLSFATGGGSVANAFFLGGKASIVFQNLSSTFTINGTPFTLVSSVSDLASTVASNPAGQFALAGPYDAAGDGTYGAAPVQTEFTGNFMGLGNAISNLTIADNNPDDDVGLFASVKLIGGAIEYVTLSNEKLLSSGSGAVGGLAGLVFGGTFRGDHMSGTISGPSAGELGGLLGYATASVIQSSSAAGKTEGGGYAGGMLGQAQTVVIASASSSAAVRSKGASAAAGGLVGFLLESTISNSSSSGAVTAQASNSNAGGLVGWSLGKIRGSLATGRVRGSTAGDWWD
jgi:hypothetical protein